MNNMDASDSIKRIFIGIDKRYGIDWDIPYAEVELKTDEIKEHNVKMAESKSGLDQLLMYGAGDYHLAIEDIAKKHKAANLRIVFK